MTLRELNEWAERNEVDPDATLLAWIRRPKCSHNRLEDIDTVCTNGPTVQLNVRDEAGQQMLERFEEVHGPDRARQLYHEHCQRTMR